MKAWKFEAWVAIAALAASSLTAAAALYQSRVFSDQLQATVWPYLAFDNTFSSTTYTLGIENDGAGPAIIMSAQLRLDGKPLRSFPELLERIAGPSSPQTYTYSNSSLSPGEVIRPGATARIVTVNSQHLKRLLPAYKRMEIEVYYCSVVKRCWRLRSRTEALPDDVSGQTLPHKSIDAGLP